MLKEIRLYTPEGELIGVIYSNDKTGKARTYLFDRPNSLNFKELLQDENITPQAAYALKNGKSLKMLRELAFRKLEELED